MTSKVKDFLPTWKIDLENEDVYSEAPVEGGPKVAKLSDDLVDSKRLIEVLNINPELPAVERDRIQEVIVKNHRAFGLDDHLGHLDHAIHISLKPGVKEISLPPFHARLDPVSLAVLFTMLNARAGWREKWKCVVRNST